MTTEHDTDIAPASDQVPRGPNRKWLLPTLTGVGGFLVGVLVVGGAVGVIYGVNVAATTAAADAVFADALEECGVPNNADAEVSDGGRTLTINVRGEEDFSGISYAEMECIERALNTPQSVISHIGQTTSMDGRQSESWDGITMSWSYHPDRGLDSVYTFDASKK